MVSSVPPLRLVIVEDHELTRLGLVVSLQQVPNIHVVGEAVDGKAGWDEVVRHQPDVVLMDVGLPLMDGVELTQRLKQTHPQVKVLMLTSHAEPHTVRASLAAGADGYCLKDIRQERLVQVIEMIAEGAAYLDPAVAALVMKSVKQGKTPLSSLGQTTADQAAFFLTERELEVLGLIVDGKSNKEIAEALVITVHTVKAHVCNIIQKLAVDDRTQAAVKALREGLVGTV